jgi:hypothetical protein
MTVITLYGYLYLVTKRKESFVCYVFGRFINNKFRVELNKHSKPTSLKKLIFESS